MMLSPTTSFCVRRCISQTLDVPIVAAVIFLEMTKRNEHKQQPSANIIQMKVYANVKVFMLPGGVERFSMKVKLNRELQEAAKSCKKDNIKKWR